MGKINQNVLAKRISEREGRKVEVNIAQIKEVVRLLLEELSREPASVVMSLVEKHSRPVWRPEGK